MKNRLFVIAAVLLWCSASSFAQRPGQLNQRLPFQCSGQFATLPANLGLPCKPQLPGTSATSASELVRYDDGATYISFDPAGSTGTYTFGIDLAGNVVGYYSDASFNYHGFIRQTNGSIVSFDDPQAVYGTFADAINDAGVVIGAYYDVNQELAGQDGFLRTPNGTYITFNAPGDVNGTQPNSINLLGAITGNYWDENYVSHGFVRDPFGHLTTFDVPGSTSTTPWSIDLEGTVVGQYFDANGSHGFQRTWDGRITTFDVPGGRNTAYYTYGGGASASINLLGVIATNYFQPIQGNPFGGNYRGAIRGWNGSYQTFDASTSGPCCTWTYPIAISPDGTTTGYDNDGYSIFHGFVRTPSGALTLFDAPGAGTGRVEGTIPAAINLFRVVTGTVRDSSFVSHGFIRLPH